MRYIQGEDMMRVQVNPQLPCGMRGCHRYATTALAEPDPDHPGLWQVVPICDDCATQLHAVEQKPHRHRHTPRLNTSEPAPVG